MTQFLLLKEENYISNIDPNDLAEKTKGLDPETTLFIVVSDC